MKMLMTAAAAISVVLIAPAPAQEVTHQLQMQPGTVGVWEVHNGWRIKDVVVGDVGVVDSLPGSTDRSLVLSAKRPGYTNILVLNQDGGIAANLGVTVAAPRRDARRVNIHTKLGNVHAYWAYSCDPGCRRVEDPFEGSDRIPPPRSVTVINLENSINQQQQQPRPQQQQ